MKATPASALQIDLAISADAPALAELHAAAFSAPWSAASIAETLGAPGAFALIAHAHAPLGFILVRAVAGEAEILTLAVAPSARRAGVGRALVAAAAERTANAGADSLWLEVAEDNTAALALYASTGFELTGRRRGYYSRPGAAVDALTMRRRLNSAPA